jgi:hypothetical protein
MSMHEARRNRTSDLRRSKKAEARVEALVSQDPDPLTAVLLILFSSFAVGLIPIMYGLNLEQIQPQAETSLTQEGLWGTFGEQD